MTIRLKLQRRQQEEQQIGKVRDLMEMYSIKVPSIPNYEYQPTPTPTPTGASSLSRSSTNVTIDPKIAKTRELFQMFGIDR